MDFTPVLSTFSRWLHDNPPPPILLLFLILVVFGLGIWVYCDSRKRRKTLFADNHMFTDLEIKAVASKKLRTLMKGSNRLKTLALDAIVAEFGDLSKKPGATTILGLYYRVRRSFPRLGERDSLDASELTDDLQSLITEFSIFAKATLAKIERRETRLDIIERITTDYDSFRLPWKLDLSDPIQAEAATQGFPAEPEMLPNNPALDDLERDRNLVVRQANGTYVAVANLPEIVAELRLRNKAVSGPFVRSYLRLRPGVSYKETTIGSAIKAPQESKPPRAKKT